MLNILNILLDILLPRSGFEKNIREMSTADFLEKSGGLTHQDDDAFSFLLRYKRKFVRDSVWALKYKGNKDVAKHFAELLHDYLVEEIADFNMFGEDIKPIIVPIPISKEHFRKRGWNHMELVLKELEKMDKENFEYSYSGLKKIKNTISQTKTKNRAERKKNIQGSFDVSDNHNFLDRTIILIDDVVTTGSTLKEAQKILKESGAKEITTIAIAH